MIVEVVCRRADVQSAATACLAATPIRLEFVAVLAGLAAPHNKLARRCLRP
jgi:hypothetical protein